MEEEKINYCSFNQENDCFVIGSKEGFTIYHTEPFKKAKKISKKMKN